MLLEHLPSLSRSVALMSEHTLVKVHLVGIKLNNITMLLEHLPSLSRSVALMSEHTLVQVHLI